MPFLLVLLTLLVVPATGAAQLRLPAPVGYVNDFANVIPAADAARMQAIIDEVRARSGGEIVVVTLPSLDGRTRDEVALQIGREWRIGAAGVAGDRGRNTGAVILVVPKETSPDGFGHLKIELGSNTSTFITAAQAGRIRDRHMLPAFQGGDYGRGIAEGVAALAVAYADHFGFELTGEFRPAPPAGVGPGPDGTWIVLMVVILMLLLFFGRRRWRRGVYPIFIPFPVAGGRHRRGPFGPGPGHGGVFGPPGAGRGFGGGFGGGGFGGFGGGGGFSGGGAGGRW